MRSPWTPLHIERAEGAYLYTKDGRKLLDAGSGAVVVNIGQGREELAKIAEETVRRLNYIVPVWVSTEREKPGQSARRDGRRPGSTASSSPAAAPSRSRRRSSSRFSIKRCKGKPSKKKNHLAPVLLSRQHAGRAFRRQQLCGAPTTSTCCSIGRRSRPRYCYRCPWGKTYPSCDIDCANALEEEIKKQGADNIAAFIAEPMMGASGGAVPPVKEYWPKSARDLRSQRHPADRRRSDDRLRPHRTPLRGRPLERETRHPHRRQGLDRRLHADGHDRGR